MSYYVLQRGYFDDSAFVNYLTYLGYWKLPQYAKYLKYPQCLMFLELLQHDSFRKVTLPSCFNIKSLRKGLKK